MLNCTICGNECFEDVSPEVVFKDGQNIICENCSIDYEETKEGIKLREF